MTEAFALRHILPGRERSEKSGRHPLTGLAHGRGLHAKSYIPTKADWLLNFAAGVSIEASCLIPLEEGVY
jgi:hypothetical protein